MKRITLKDAIDAKAKADAELNAANTIALAAHHKWVAANMAVMAAKVAAKEASKAAKAKAKVVMEAIDTYHAAVAAWNADAEAARLAK